MLILDSNGIWIINSVGKIGCFKKYYEWIAVYETV